MFIEIWRREDLEGLKPKLKSRKIFFLCIPTSFSTEIT